MPAGTIFYFTIFSVFAIGLSPTVFGPSSSVASSSPGAAGGQSIIVPNSPPNSPADYYQSQGLLSSPNFRADFLTACGIEGCGVVSDGAASSSSGGGDAPPSRLVVVAGSGPGIPTWFARRRQLQGRGEGEDSSGRGDDSGDGSSEVRGAARNLQGGTPQGRHFARNLQGGTNSTTSLTLTFGANTVQLVLPSSADLASAASFPLQDVSAEVDQYLAGMRTAVLYLEVSFDRLRHRTSSCRVFTQDILPV